MFTETHQRWEYGVVTLDKRHTLSCSKCKSDLVFGESYITHDENAMCIKCAMRVINDMEVEVERVPELEVVVRSAFPNLDKPCWLSGCKCYRHHAVYSECERARHAMRLDVAQNDGVK